MKITIIYNSIDFDELDNVSRLLWSVVPFAKKINLASVFCNLILLYLNKDNLSERNKIDYIKFALRKNKQELIAKEIEKAYQGFLKLKNMKHKSKTDLLDIDKAKKTFESIFLDTINPVISLEEINGLKELHTLFANPKDDVIGCYEIDVNGRNNFSAREQVMISTTIMHDYEIPIFAGKAEDFISIDENTEIENGNSETVGNKISVYRKKFLEFASPRSLTLSKLKIIRNELVRMFEPYGEKLKELKSDLLLNDRVISSSEAGLIYDNTLLPLSLKLQEAIAENIYFQQIANSGEGNSVYTLYFCVCSIDDLLMLFENAAFLHKDTIECSREELKDITNIKRSTIFLYLKVSKNGNNDY